MLVLSRKQGQKIQIGNGVTMVVLGFSGSTIRLGFEGPQDVPIHRGEVYARLRQQPCEDSAGRPGSPEPVAA